MCGPGRPHSWRLRSQSVCNVLKTCQIQSEIDETIGSNFMYRLWRDCFYFISQKFEKDIRHGTAASSAGSNSGTCEGLCRNRAPVCTVVRTGLSEWRAYMRKSMPTIIGLGVLAVGAVAASSAFARGPGGGGPPGLAGGGPPGHSANFTGGTPPGWNSPGLKQGWVNGQPPGFTKGKKKGWNRGALSGSAPPGWQR